MKDPLILFSRAPAIGNLLIITGFCLLIGCAPAGQHAVRPDGESRSYRSPYSLTQQKAPPENIRSIRFYPENSPGDPPVYELDGRQRLILSFDYIGEEARQFRLEISHRNADWQKSSLNPSRYLEGFEYTYLQTEGQNFGRDPQYQRVHYTFPGDDLRPAVSGNYLLEVYDYSNGDLLFSVPFFVSENAGTLATRVEQIFATRKDGRSLDQLFSTYVYPTFIDFPQFDLSFYFAPNQFWGRTRRSRTYDTSTPGEVSFHLSRDNAFIADYNFQLLDLRSLKPDGRQILEYHPETTPPRVILRRDVVNLDPSPMIIARELQGSPLDDRHSGYADVHFSLDAAEETDTTATLYIVGAFNNWMLSEENRMRFNKAQKLWEGRALIKQGEYAYKYVRLINGGIDDLSLDNNFISSLRQYTTFVYFRDPDLNFDRLLQVRHLVRE